MQSNVTPLKTADRYQKLETNHTYMSESGYQGIHEGQFSATHPEIQEWTRRFMDAAYMQLNFEAFHAATPRSKAKAIAVSTQWYQFSSFMPWFLCQAAANVSNNEKRHYVIQTAFEELGMRDVTEIHPEMFRQTCAAVGISPANFDALGAYQPIQGLLQRLTGNVLATRDDDFIMGMLLGLELPAEDNISSVFWSAAHDDGAEASLRDSKFFKLHMALETEHVRLTVSNFLRFCDTDAKKLRFQDGFAVGIDFWRDFWNTLGDLTKHLTR